MMDHLADVDVPLNEQFHVTLPLLEIFPDCKWGVFQELERVEFLTGETVRIDEDVLMDGEALDAWQMTFVTNSAGSERIVFTLYDPSEQEWEARLEFSVDVHIMQLNPEEMDALFSSSRLGRAKSLVKLIWRVYRGNDVK